MKITRKIVSAILAATMMFGLTACGRSPKISPSDLVKASEKYDAKLYDDSERFIKKYRELEEYDKPIVLSVEGRDAQEYYDEYFNTHGYYINADVEAMAFFAYDYDNHKSNRKYGHILLMSFVCESDKEAEDLYESFISGVAVKDEPNIISEDEKEPFVVVYEARPNFTDICYWGIYRKGDTVFRLTGVIEDSETKVRDMFTYFCKQLNIKDPAEAVKESDK